MARRYLNAEGAAEYLGFGSGDNGASTIRQMVHRRQIPYHKIGSRLRFDMQALDAWMAKHRVAAEE